MVHEGNHPRAPAKRKQVLNEPFWYVSIDSAHTTGAALVRQKRIWSYKALPYHRGGALLRVYMNAEDKDGQLWLYTKSQGFKRTGNLGQLRMADGILKKFVEDDEYNSEVKAYLAAARRAISIAYNMLSPSQQQMNSTTNITIQHEWKPDVSNIELKTDDERRLYQMALTGPTGVSLNPPAIEVYRAAEIVAAALRERADKLREGKQHE